uniref:ATPase, AAA family protein n=1 Tax=Babesia bovis TaxID=5865 RepID=A7AMC1_BABBO|eukprot:XP_001611273.1 ATPase, AAA family protein [Babesia bovis T2Bo]
MFGFGSPQVPSSAIPPLPNDDANITGKFDPTALERGAKALKMLDSSPNAQKAFELTKMQEMTRQHEIQKEIQQMQLRQSELGAQRARVESDEKRKLMAQQQEQDRITAQYKAKLEAEAYQKKLQDQRRQNEEWLNQQHQQFLRQEEARKKTEMEILNMRKAQIREEKALERENIKARVQEEGRIRIEQERKNFDIHVKMMKERSVEERKTKLESLQITFSSLGTAFSSLLADKQRLTAGERRLGKPPLVRETSRWTLMGGISNLFKRYFPTGNVNALTKIVLDNNLHQRLSWTTNSLMNAKKNGAPFRNLLLYGPPGTGKTLFAKTLASNSGMDFAIMTGGDIGPLQEEAASEINKLFKWAKKTKKGLLLFIDEADAFLRQGRSSANGMSENMRNALSAFLYHTGTESKELSLILATNEREILDKAVLDRMDEQYEFGLPQLEERKRMIAMFMKKYVLTPTTRGNKVEIDENINDDFFAKVAERTEGFSGRQLSKMCIAIQSAVFGSGTTRLSLELAETVINWHIDEHRKNHKTTEHAEPAD